MSSLGRVLVVHDDPDMLRFFTLVLRKAGLTVEVASSGTEGLDKLQEMGPDLIICNVRMPQMNGYEFCRAVRQSPGLEDVPFLFCSTLGNLPMRMEGLRVGADDYIVKPVLPQDLQFRVQALLQRERKLQGLRRTAEEHFAEPIVLTASLGGVNLIDLLQLHAFQERDCLRILLKDSAGQEGEVVMIAKELVHASLGSYRGPKAFFRLLAWQDGTVTVQRAAPPGAPTMSGKLNNWLLDGAVQLDEYKLIRGKMMEGGGRFRAGSGDACSRPELSPTLAETLDLVKRLGDLDAILEASPAPDLEIMRRLSSLLELDLVEHDLSS